MPPLAAAAVASALGALFALTAARRVTLACALALAALPLPLLEAAADATIRSLYAVAFTVVATLLAAYLLATPSRRLRGARRRTRIAVAAVGGAFGAAVLGTIALELPPARGLPISVAAALAVSGAGLVVAADARRVAAGACLLVLAASLVPSPVDAPPFELLRPAVSALLIGIAATALAIEGGELGRGGSRWKRRRYRPVGRARSSGASGPV